MRFNAPLLSSFLYPVVFLATMKAFSFLGDMSLWLSAFLALLPSLFVIIKTRGFSDFKLPKKEKGEFLISLIYLFSVAFLFDYLLGVFNPILESFFNSFGYSASTAVPSKEDFRLPVLLYVVLIGPVCEEFCYRYTLMEGLKRYGSFKVIFISSLLFGLMHLNFYQGLSAFFSALVFGYAYEIYGIFASIALHISSNLLAIAFDYLNLKGLWGQDVISIIFIFLLIVFILGTIKVIRNRRRKNSILKEHQELAMLDRWESLLLVVYVLAFFIYTILSSFHRL